MATSTAAATALLRSSPAVPAKVKPYSIKLRTGTLVYFPTRLTVACGWRSGGVSMRLLGGRRREGGELQGSCELASTLSGTSASSEKPSRRTVSYFTVIWFSQSHQLWESECFVEREPVAFMGGVFAGLLRLDLNEDPLKEWITRTVEASGIAEENSSEESSEADQNDAPQQIEIE
ncbi:unnamed protein product [Miscanthus lutarioriparius]|uniref:Uncharacterized protein n=1 Tax=Miscanthus lutarioriparius TaxID=422564 RepID=A0A811QPH1_9POAL|nr:unnamed protein product [Miscanthus lutarioriparius]